MNAKIINLFESEIKVGDIIKLCEDEITKLENQCLKLQKERERIFFTTYRPRCYLDDVIHEKNIEIEDYKSRIQELNKG